jgi:RNA polymerase sigma factor (TIGR02999 family)
MSEITRILQDIETGDRTALDRLLGTVYEELRRLAISQMAQERPGQTLEPTALVHEAYLRLFGDQSVHWANRRHFFGAAAEAMRRILVEAARRKAREKHGGGRDRCELGDADAITPPTSVDLLALDEALEELAREDPLKAKLVQLRYFAGLSVEQAGEVLGISRATADRYWRFARAWLFDAIEGRAGGEPRED